jgi:ABC-type dipeptide/oligopeptide/nickel transport system permease subunit
VALFTPSATVAIIVISLFSWTGPARIFRAQVIALKQQDYVLAARAIGATELHMFRYHILPHLVPLIIVTVTLSIPPAIFAEASLSFFGLGVPPPIPTWGSMVQEGTLYYRAAPWVVIFPGLALMITVIALNLVGKGLRDALDPASFRR